MGKMKNTASLLLALMLIWQLFALGVPSAYADGDTAMKWAVVCSKDGEQLVLSDVQAVTEQLGSGFVFEAGAAEPTVADLQKNGLRIAPPAGWVFRSLLIVTEGQTPDPTSKSLLSLAQLDSTAAGAIFLPAAIFADGFDASAVGRVFNGSGEGGYLVQIELAKAAEALSVHYSLGAVGDSLRPLVPVGDLVAGGEEQTLSIPAGQSAAVCSVASLSSDAEAAALKQLGCRFTGWKLTFSSGMTKQAQSGEQIAIFENVSAEAQWEESIVFSFESGEKMYDGTPLTVGYSRVGTLKDGDSLTVPDNAVHASITDAGSAEATLDLSAVSVMRGEQNVTGEYRFQVLPGTMRVVKRGITFRVTDVNAPYTGQPVRPTDFSIQNGSLVDGHRAVPSYSGEQTLPGSSTASGVFTIRDDADNDVTANYDISVINGSITVSDREDKQPLTITLRNCEKEYDGSNAVQTGYDITAGTLLGGDELTVVSMDGSITGVGSGSVNAVFAVKNGANDVTGNYEITVVGASLTVKPRAITLTAASAEKDFDGKELKNDGFTISAGSVVEGHTLTASVKGSQTAVGSSANKIDPQSVTITDAEGKNVTAQYRVALVDGTLTVKAPADAAALTITMKSAEKTYDGKELVSKEYTITSGKLADGDELVLGEVTGSQTDAGESSVTAVFTVKNGNDDVTAKYTITVVPGKLTVKSRAVTVTAASASKIYDGRPLTRDSYSITSGELVKGHKLTASVSGSQTEIGSSANSIVKSSIKITDSSGKDVSANYTVTAAAGTLSVGRDPITSITLSPGDHSKVYDGTPYVLRGTDLKVTSGSLPAGYSIQATFNPESPVDAGRYDITIKSVKILSSSGGDVTSQFNITRLKGTLTITPRPMTIETSAANKSYDGSALTERSTPTITGRVDGQQVTLRITGSQTKVGSSENTVSDVKITDKTSGADVTKNYDIRYQYGLLTVTDADKGTANAVWINGSSGTLFIKLDHSYDGFEGLLVDGKTLDRDNYTSASGSTDVWLKAAYLNTLSAGEHTLSARYSGGESVQASFTVQRKEQTARTGDSNHLTTWIVIMILALVAIAAAAGALVWTGKNSSHKRRVRKTK